MQLVLKVEVTRGQHLPIYWCQTASQVSLFIGFLLSWISLPTKTTKICTPQIKMISQYIYLSTNKLKKNSMMVIFYCDRGLTANHLLLIFFMTIYFHDCLKLLTLTTALSPLIWLQVYKMCAPPNINFCIHAGSHNIISNIYTNVHLFVFALCISIKTYSNRPTPV